MAKKKYYVDVDLDGNELQNGLLHILSAHPSSPSEGQIYYNDGGGSLVGGIWYYNGTIWVNDAVDSVPYIGALGNVNLGEYSIDIKRLLQSNNGHSIWIGEGSGESDDNTDNYNIGIGSHSQHRVNTGDYNTSIGNGSLKNNSSGSNNVAVGNNAGAFISNGTTSVNTSDNSVFIGGNTKAESDEQNNQIVIGYDAIGNGSNTATLGNDNVTDIYANEIGTAIVHTGGITIGSSFITAQENIDVDAGTETIATIPAADCTAVFFDFSIKKGTNLRAGTVIATHDGTTVVYNESSTGDLGDTSMVRLSVDIDGGNIRLLATSTTNDWIIKTLVRTI